MQFGKPSYYAGTNRGMQLSGCGILVTRRSRATIMWTCQIRFVLICM